MACSRSPGVFVAVRGMCQVGSGSDQPLRTGARAPCRNTSGLCSENSWNRGSSPLSGRSLPPVLLSLSSHFPTMGIFKVILTLSTIIRNQQLTIIKLFYNRMEAPFIYFALNGYIFYL